MPWTADDLLGKHTAPAETGDPTYQIPEIIANFVPIRLVPCHGADVLDHEIEEHIGERLIHLHSRGAFEGGRWLYDVTKAVIIHDGAASSLLLSVEIARPGYLCAHEHHYKLLLENMTVAGVPWHCKEVDVSVAVSNYLPSKARGWPDGVTRVASTAAITMVPVSAIPDARWHAVTLSPEQDVKYDQM